jgi:DNA-binding protein Fis
MIKIKQDSKMSYSVYEFLAGFEVSAETLGAGLEKTFQEFLKASAASCGVVVLYSEEEAGFVEVCSVGYDDSGFFYEFLARGKGNFEKIESSPKPMVFYRNHGFQLFNFQSELAIVSRIYGKQMYGFVLVELEAETLLSFLSWTLGWFSQRIASILERKTEREIQVVSNPQAGRMRDSWIELLLSYSGDWISKLKDGYSQKVISLKAEIGMARSQIAKYFHHILELPGEIFFLNLVPEKISRLQKSIFEWSQMTGKGMLVIENTHLLDLHQQKLFYEYIKKQNNNLCFLFYESSVKLPEMYAPFWKLIREVQIAPPSISDLERDKRLMLLSALVKEVGWANNKKGISVTMESMEFLLDKSTQLSLEEIRNVLESSVLRCKGTVIQKSDLERYWSEIEKTVVVQESEDLDLRKSVEALERQKILLAHKLFSGNQMRMAKALGISRGSLQYKMKQMELL